MLGLLAFVAMFTSVWEKVRADVAAYNHERIKPTPGHFHPTVFLTTMVLSLCSLLAFYPFVRFFNWLYGV